MSDGPSPRRDPRPEDEDQRQSREWHRYSQLAMEFIAYLAALGYAGWWMDQRYGWKGRGLLAGLLLGMAAWIYRVLKQTWHLFK